MSYQQATVLAPLTEDIVSSISQPILKEVIAFSVALFFFSPTFILKFYLSLEKLMNLQRSFCTILIKDYL